MSRTLTTDAAVRSAVVAVARGEVGKHYGLVAGVPNPTPYGKWYGPGWERALFCAAGASWCASIALGEDDARYVMGHQTHGGTAPHRRGYVWTVAMWEQLKAHRAPLRDLRAGDLVLYKYPTSGTRNTNPVNHVDVVEVNRPDLGYVDCIGFNVPRPGAPAGTDQSMGGGVWRRRTWYGNGYVVGGLRLPYAALAERNRKAWAGVQQHLHTLEYGDYLMSGTYGPATKAGVDAYAADTGYTGDRTDPLTLLVHMEATMSKLDQIIATQREHTDLLRAARADHGRVHTDLADLGKNILAAIAALPVPTVTDIVAGVWSYAIPGHGNLNAWWWLRRGSVLSPKHDRFPADPGSPADKELRAEAALRNGRASVYTADGTVDVVLDENARFVLDQED